MQLRPSQVPPEVLKITEKLEKSGFEAWIVGGCVRDLLLGRKPNDWDVTTNATPEQIQALFEKTFYENVIGKVPAHLAQYGVVARPFRQVFGNHADPEQITFFTSEFGMSFS